jgi:hypothetical protein
MMSMWRSGRRRKVLMIRILLEGSCRMVMLMLG